MTPDVVARYDRSTRPQADFIRREAMVPMRDGTKLYTVIVMKKGTTNGADPAVAHALRRQGQRRARTPSQRIVDILPIMDTEFVNDGYIRVYQDIRGLHNSEGQFVMNRPIVGPLNNTGIDESTDAYDTIDWLVKNVPGIERQGRHRSARPISASLTLASEINPHPALKAAVPQSPMVDGWMGDDWFHNGAFRTGSLDFAVSQSTGKAEGGGIADRRRRRLHPLPRGRLDGRLCAPSSASTMYPFVQKLIQNPAYTDFWSRRRSTNGWPRIR